MTKSLKEIEDEKIRNYELLRKRAIADFGLNGLHFLSKYQYLHRVFNNGSFKEGGRFYGAFHLEMPKELRQYIYINGEPTLELDYSALHIRMLYHLEGVDYREDPYTAICQDDAERKIYKLAQLIAINAESEDKAVMAIRNQLRKNKIDFNLKNESIHRCLRRFKEGHPRVAKYLNTGIGLKLQNLDSKVTEKILKTMTHKQIPCLPVHDSFIVTRKDGILLKEVMNESYKQVMGFEAVID